MANVTKILCELKHLKKPSVPISGFALSLLQLDVNLIEGEPYNRLTQKTKMTESRMTIFKFSLNLGNGIRNPTKTNGISGGPSLVSITHNFCSLTNPPAQWVTR